VNLLQDTGLPQNIVDGVIQSSNTVFDVGIIATALLIPSHRKQEEHVGSGVKDNQVLLDVDDDIIMRTKDESVILLLNQIIQKSAIIAVASKIINSITGISFNGFDEIVSFSFICVICLREIIYYGAAYKVEAIFAIILSLLHVLGINDYFVAVTLSLALMVLSVGKVFEPLKDDLQRNGSQFFINK
jgi:hypothetical protein